ncbi:hypothetical protein GCM10027034_43170 [Ramlibacter solisilvae]
MLLAIRISCWSFMVGGFQNQALGAAVGARSLPRETDEAQALSLLPGAFELRPTIGGAIGVRH